MFLHVQISEKDMALVKEAAYINRMGVSAFVRNVVVNEALNVVPKEKRDEK